MATKTRKPMTDEQKAAKKERDRKYRASKKGITVLTPEQLPRTIEDVSRDQGREMEEALGPVEGEQGSDPTSALEVVEADLSKSEVGVGAVLLSEGEIQEVVNDLMWEYGAFFQTKPEAQAILESQCIAPDQITDEMLANATTAFQERVMANLNQTVLTWQEPTEKISDVTSLPYQTWRTVCGQYRVCRMGGYEPRFTALARVVAKNATEGSIGKEFHGLRQAFEAVEKYHQVQMDLPTVETNAETIIKHAEERQWDKRPISEQTQKEKAQKEISVPIVDLEAYPSHYEANPERRCQVNVTEEKARSLLVNLGFKTAASSKAWKTDKVAKRLNEIAQYNGELKEIESDDDKMVLSAILSAIKNGEEITVGTAKKPSANGKASKPKAESKTKSVPASTKDRFGSREGSQAATINAAIGTSPMPLDDLAKKTGLPNARIKSHVKWLLDQKLIEQTDKGIKVKK